MPLTPDEIRQRQFEVTRRGYDREAVERFRDEVAANADELARALDDFRGRLGQLGIDQLPDLGEELSRVAADVGTILEDARRAATDMRRRAEEDAARWRAEAETEAAAARAEAEREAGEWREQAGADAAAVRAGADGDAAETRAEAQRQAEEMRGSAWVDSAAMIERARADADAMLAEATQDALFIKAGAERDALRQTGTARQDAEAELKRARSDALRIVREAEQESARLVDEATQVRAEAAEEVRALEQERIELLVDIDTMQRTIDQMDVELEARNNPTPPDGGDRAEWQTEPAVRVVPASRIRTPPPVDADELVAEVSRLRMKDVEQPAGADDDAGSTPEDAGAGDDTSTGEPAEEVPPAPVGGGGATPGDVDATPAPPGGADVIELPRTEAEVIDLPVGPATHVGPPRAARGELTAGRDRRAEPVIDDLFASLRTSVATAVPVVVEEIEPAGAPAPAETRGSARLEAAAAGEIRTRLLLPVENDALRQVKRGVVDLQNRALADIHDDPTGWTLDPAEVGSAFAAPVASLVRAAYAAGHRAAGEMTGRPAPDPVEDTAPLATADPGGELANQLNEARRRVAAVEAAPKETADALSRVYRAWRTDEAERRLHEVALSAFHHGVLSGLAMLGVERVATVADTRPCADCVARAEPWDPAGPPPSGWVMPPAHPGCVVSIVPA